MIKILVWFLEELFILASEGNKGLIWIRGKDNESEQYFLETILEDSETATKQT